MGQKGGPPGTRQMHVGMGRHWVGYLCLCMSNNEQPQCSANYFALHQHESKKDHMLHVQPWLFLGPFLPSSGSDQQVHLALGLHRSELIKSQTVKNFINSPSWSIYVESPHFSASRCSGCFQGLLQHLRIWCLSHGLLTCIQVPASPWSHIYNQPVN